jgi:predicted nucleic acid-binding protein
MAAVLAARLTPVVSDAVLAEYGSVLTRPRLRLDPEQVRRALDAMRDLGVPIHAPPAPPPALPDPDDWPFIACALAAGCPVITGNARDFPARLGIRVVAAREWVEKFDAEA